MLKALIIEDEINAKGEMELLLNETGEVDVLRKCSNALEGIKAINSLHPDVVFLDIQLPVINGFEMLSMIEESNLPRIVFVTAYDEYAIKAFENDAIDYLLKPVELERLKKTIEKLKNSIQNNNPQNLTIPELRRIPSIGANKIKLVDIDIIEYVHSNETGVYFFCNNKKCFTELTLKVLGSRTKFLRCHKQYLINPDKIDEIQFEENSTGRIKTVNNNFIPISRHYLKKLKERLGI
ncbi:transcriptional regulatory protein YehT [bacterium BMS3Bbin03]|nr:transcriptional regulatory protein YehT [bacterium BMS3Bbin03]